VPLQDVRDGIDSGNYKLRESFPWVNVGTCGTLKEGAEYLESPSMGT